MYLAVRNRIVPIYKAPANSSSIRIHHFLRLPSSSSSMSTQLNHSAIANGMIISSRVLGERRQCRRRSPPFLGGIQPLRRPDSGKLTKSGSMRTLLPSAQVMSPGFQVSLWGSNQTTSSGLPKPQTSKSRFWLLGEISRCARVRANKMGPSSLAEDFQTVSSCRGTDFYTASSRSERSATKRRKRNITSSSRC